jgi:GNAT superfamily N-acetyltransferase
MTYNTFLFSDCSTFEAAPAHVAAAYQNLNRDMNPEFVHVFLDKLERYARKPDRALFLIEYQKNIIAFATIIDSAPVPDILSKEQVSLLTGYSCGTGLMVLPEYRKNGVASLLVNQWEEWSLKNGLPGIWVVTKKMDEWYRKHFDYSYLTRIKRRGVKKTILHKQFITD